MRVSDESFLQAMTGIYPVATYLHQIGKVASKQCQYCTTGQDETLSHSFSVCSRFHDAQTADNNQIRRHLSVSLGEPSPGGWKLYEEPPLCEQMLACRCAQSPHRTSKSPDA